MHYKKEEILAIVLAILADELNVDDPQPDMKINDLNLDSMGFVVIIASMEIKLNRALYDPLFDRPKFYDPITIGGWAEKVTTYLNK